MKDRKTLLERPTSCFIFAPLFTNDVTVFVFAFIRGHVLWIEWLKYYNDRRYGYILMFRNCFTSLQASENWDRQFLNIMSRFILNIVWKSWICFSGTSTKREIICAHWQVIILQVSNCFHCRDRRIRKLIFFEQEVLHPKMSYQGLTFEWLFFFIFVCVFCRGYQLHNAFHTIWSSNVGSNAAVSFHDHL